MTDDILKVQAATQGLSRSDIKALITKYLSMDRIQVQRAIAAPETPMIEILIASLVANAAQKGDPVRAAFIMQQLRFNL